MIKNTFITIILLFTIFSCRKEQDLPTANNLVFKDYAVGVPLVESSLSIEDMVQKASSDTSEFYMVYDKSCCYQFVYTDSYTFANAEEYITLPENINFGNTLKSFPLTIPGGASPSALIPPVSYTITIAGVTSGLNKAKIQNILFKSGLLNLALTKKDITGGVSLSADIIFDNILKKSGNTDTKLTLTVSNLIDGIAKTADNTPLDLKDYYWKIGGSTVPTLNITIALKNITTSNNAGGATNLSITSLNLQNPKWKRIDGRLGTVTIPVKKFNSEFLDINKIFLSVFNGNAITTTDTSTIRFNFKEPSVDLDFTSSFGVPITLIDSIYSVNKKGETNFVDVTTRAAALGPIQIKKANDPGFDNFAGISPAITPTYSINKDNNPSQLSTLQSILQPGPRVLESGIVLKLDSSGNSPTDYIFDKSTISSKTTVRIPLYGYVSLFNMRTVIDYPFKESDTPDTKQTASGFNLTINAANFKLDYVNNMPLAILFQAYFTDVNGNYIDSLFVTPVTTSDGKKRGGLIIEGSAIAADGNPSTATIPNQPIVTVMDANRYLNIRKNCKKMILTGNMFSTGFVQTPITNSTNVKIRPQDKLKIKISMAATANLGFTSK
ncbi:MAG: hypothetical protein SFY32_04370 [Bacteroidota bacterium]|nr:hypothetical protein [Bacteroidota bacterium]